MEEAAPPQVRQDVGGHCCCKLEGQVCSRRAGHLGVSIEHYAWGRVGSTALGRFVRQWHAHQNL
eukprot:2179757-Lingulodinium_polyedra.AAC.1